ncbi:MAG: hypothetical protein HFJ57_00865 [Clostridia bacterium]|nr:hypothetical protein [Clostridia bacterium]
MIEKIIENQKIIQGADNEKTKIKFNNFNCIIGKFDSINDSIRLNRSNKKNC